MDYLNISVIFAKYIACTKYLATAIYILRFVPNFINTVTIVDSRNSANKNSKCYI